MKNLLRFSAFASLTSLLFFATGCATKSSTAKRINSLEAQVGVLTDEVAKLDQQLQQTRAGNALPSAYTGGAQHASQTAIYRTPSGFELPSADIQKALKGAGYYQGAVDGKIGASSKDAIKAFQKDHGLEADGVVGRRTWDKLKTYTASAAS